MKKMILSIAFIVAAMALASCAHTIGDSESLDSPSLPSISNASDLTSSTLPPSTSTSTKPEYSNVINEAQLLSLIANAPSADLNIVLSSETELDIYGQDNGIRYHQTQTINETTYSNDITIGSGTLKHYYVNDPNYTYESNLTTLRLLKNDIYYDITMYDNDAFTSTTSAINLNWFDEDSLDDLRNESRVYISSGVGYEVYEDFLLGYSMGASIAFESKFLNDDLSVTVYMECESSNTNQYYLATFSYLFDLNDLHVKDYAAKQAYYSLLAYQANNYSIEGLTPIDSVMQKTRVTTGRLTEFNGDLPYDIESLFVQEINLSAATTEIKVGETVALKAEVLPETAIDKNLAFSSSNDAIASVDDSGRVKGKTTGTVIITAENIYSGVTGEIEITVLPLDKPDAGDDSAKLDLKEALNASTNQVFSTPTQVKENGSLQWSSTGMIIDNEQSINSKELATLTVSDFAYNAVLRQAIYIGDMAKLESIIPFFDNGIEALSNRYLIKDRYIYREVIISFELVLGTSNTISYVKVVCRTDSISYDKKTVDVKTLNNDNVDSVGELTVNEYTKNVYYESRGFIYED